MVESSRTDPRPPRDIAQTTRIRGSQFQRGLSPKRRNLPSRASDWIVVHPVVWGAGAGVVLVVLGGALGLPPIVVVAAGTAIGVLNILHAKKRGSCPLPAEAERPIGERSDG